MLTNGVGPEPRGLGGGPLGQGGPSCAQVWMLYMRTIWACARRPILYIRVGWASVQCAVRDTECPPLPTHRTHVPRERPDQLCHVLGVEEAKLHVAVLRVAVTAGESTYE